MGIGRKMAVGKMGVVEEGDDRGRKEMCSRRAGVEMRFGGKMCFCWEIRVSLEIVGGGWWIFFGRERGFRGRNPAPGGRTGMRSVQRAGDAYVQGDSSPTAILNRTRV
jgi:hypothetical protein